MLDQGRYKTQFLDAVYHVEQDLRFVDLTFKVTNQGQDTTLLGLPPTKWESAFTGQNFADSIVRITPAVKTRSGPLLFVTSKAGETRQLHPNVPATVTLRFKLDGQDPPPAKLTLDVAGFEYEPGFNDPTSHWSIISDEEDDKFFPEVKAQVTLPVTAKESA